MRELAEFEKYAEAFAITEEILREQGFRRSPPDFYCLVADESGKFSGRIPHPFREERERMGTTCLSRYRRSTRIKVSVPDRGSFHFDFHAHPGMDAALKKMFTFRQTRDLALATLKDSGFGHREVRKAAATFGNRVFSWGIKHR